MPTIVAMLMTLAAATAPVAAETLIVTTPTGSFAFEFTVDLPGTPEEMYDGLTGDISGWWDHSMSGDPHALAIDAKPGGTFHEIFDESGDGVVHAVVTYAHRGRLLRMEGPMGLAGNAINMVTTWTLAPTTAGASTLTVSVHATGEIQPEWGSIVASTWRHFIEERFVPWATAGHHLENN